MENLEAEILTSELITAFQIQMKNGSFKSIPELVESIRKRKQIKNLETSKKTAVKNDGIEITEEDKNQLKNWGISI